MRGNASIITDSNVTLTLPISVLVCTATSSILSICGAIVIFITYAVIPESKNTTRRLLIYLTICDLITCCGNLLGTIRYYIRYNDNGILTSNDCFYSSELCVFQSFLTTFSSMGSFFWTFIISLHLYLSVVYNTEWIGKIKVKVACHFISWGIPMIITLTATFYSVLGEDFSQSSGAWCWIKGCLYPGYLMTIWMTISGKGWEMLTYILTCYLYLRLKFFMYKQRKQQHRPLLSFTDMSQELRAEDENFVFIWLVLYLLRIWGTVRYFIAISRIHNMSHPVFDDIDKVLVYFQSIGDSGQAFCNCIIFCFLDKTVRHGMIVRMCPRRQRGLQHMADSEDDPLLRNVN